MCLCIDRFVFNEQVCSDYKTTEKRRPSFLKQQERGRLYTIYYKLVFSWAKWSLQCTVDSGPIRVSKWGGGGTWNPESLKYLVWSPEPNQNKQESGDPISFAFFFPLPCRQLIWVVHFWSTLFKHLSWNWVFFSHWVLKKLVLHLLFLAFRRLTNMTWMAVHWKCQYAIPDKGWWIELLGGFRGMYTLFFYKNIVFPGIVLAPNMGESWLLSFYWLVFPFGERKLYCIKIFSTQNNILFKISASTLSL